MIPALKRQRQVISELETSLVYIMNSRNNQDYTEKPCLKKTKTNENITENVDQVLHDWGLGTKRHQESCSGLGQ